MSLIRHIFSSIIIVFLSNFTLFSFAECLYNDSISSDSALYITGKEIVITKPQSKKMTGLSVGKITFNPIAVSTLPSLLGNTDLLKLLELTPGVQNSGDANTNLYVKGGDSGQNLLLYNNVPLYTPGHLLGFFSLFNSDPISSLELNKTGINARYGGRLSSIIDVTTKNNVPEKTSIKGNVGLLSSQATLELPLENKFGLSISGRKTYLELLMQPILNATVNNNAKNKVEDLDYNFYDTNITLVGLLSDKDKITVDAFFSRDNFNISETDLLLNGKLNWKSALFSTKWDKRMKENLFSQQIYAVSYDNELLTSQAEMNINMMSKVQDVGYKNKYLFTVHDLPFEVGLQYAFHEITPQTYDIINAEQKYSLENPHILQAHDAGLYTSSNFSLTPQLSADLGLRYNLFVQDKTFQSIEPRVLLRYQLNETTVFRAVYNRQNQYLNLLSPSSVGIPLDFWITASNKIPPQSGNDYSLGYFQSFHNDAFELSGEIYYRTINNVNEYSQNFISGQNNSYIDNVFVGTGRAYGVGILLKKNFGKFTGWGSYALGRSERTFDEINEGKPFPAQFDRRHDLSLVATYAFNEKWDASIVYAYATGNTYTLPSSWYFINNTPVKEYGKYNGSRMPDYNRTDLSVNYWFKKDNGLSFSVYNAFIVNNPIYIFMNIIQEEETGITKVEIKQKRLYSIIPSISWRFKF